MSTYGRPIMQTKDTVMSHSPPLIPDYFPQPSPKFASKNPAAEAQRYDPETVPQSSGSPGHLTKIDMKRGMLTHWPRMKHTSLQIPPLTNNEKIMEQDWRFGGEAFGRNFEAIKASLSQKLLKTEKASEFIITLIYCVPILAPVRICIEWSIFRNLVHAKRSLHARELVAAHRNNFPEAEDDVEERVDIVARMLRVVTAIGVVDEVAPRTYLANELTTLMADPGFAAGFQLLFDNAMGPRSTMIELVCSSRSKAPITATDGPWQRARGTVGETTFEQWERNNPLQLTRLSRLMQRMQPETPHWTDWLPADALFGKGQPLAAPFLVDVGGGRGHDISALAARYPGRDVQLVLQDLPRAIQEGVQERERSGVALDPRISLSEHDFFQPQPVKGAAIYYLHKIMHDWPDEDCISILKHLRDAMGPLSRILINDVVLPNTGASLLHAAFDIDMLALHSGRERERASWQSMIAKVGGLECLGFRIPPIGNGESIVEIRRSVF